MVSVAMDAQGPRVVRPWHEKAGAEFPTLVDRENLLLRLFGFKVIPLAILFDEKGRHIKGPYDANIGDAEFGDELVKWATDPAFEKSLAATSKKLGRKLSAKEKEAEARFQIGKALLDLGKKEEAMAEWREAAKLDPKNWIIRKQIWAVENPDRFYKERVDYDWQKEQLKAEK